MSCENDVNRILITMMEGKCPFLYLTQTHTPGASSVQYKKMFVDPRNVPCLTLRTFTKIDLVALFVLILSHFYVTYCILKEIIVIFSFPTFANAQYCNKIYF